MKNIFSTILVLSLINVSLSAHAGWVSFGKVKAIHDGPTHIHFRVDTSNPNNPCSRSGSATAYSLPRSHENFAEMYSMLLAAQVTEQRGRVATNGNCAPYQEIKNFMLGEWTS